MGSSEDTEPIDLRSRLNRDFDLSEERVPESARLAGLKKLLHRIGGFLLVSQIGNQRQFNSDVVQLLNAFLDRMDFLLLEAERERQALRLETRKHETGYLSLRRQLKELGETLQKKLPDETLEAPEVAMGLKSAADRVARELDDTEYLHFEDRFRGDPETVKAHLREYASEYMESGDVGNILDLGCGRGEFLSLLKEAGLSAIGVDSNREAVEMCRRENLDVHHGDLLEHLRAQGPASLGGVFAFQVVEHLPPRRIRELVDLAYGSLKKDGRILLETINPGSLTAYMNNFHADPTHNRVLHPQTLRFFLEAAGFRNVAVRFTSPVAPERKLRELPDGSLPDEQALDALNFNISRINEMLFGDEDYAVTGVR